MNMTDHTPALPLLQRRLKRLSTGVTSRAVLEAYTDGRIHVEGLAADQGRLEELRRLIGVAGASGAAEAVRNVTAAPSGAQEPETLLRDADPAKFAAARVERSPMAWTSARDMWASYVAWTEERSESPVDPSSFCRILRASGLRAGRRRPDGKKQQRGWAGGRLLPMESPQLHLVDATAPEVCHG
jgi:hypothetical protein